MALFEQIRRLATKITPAIGAPPPAPPSVSISPPGATPEERAEAAHGRLAEMQAAEWKSPWRKIMRAETKYGPYYPERPHELLPKGAPVPPEGRAPPTSFAPAAPPAARAPAPPARIPPRFPGAIVPPPTGVAPPLPPRVVGARPPGEIAPGEVPPPSVVTPRARPAERRVAPAEEELRLKGLEEELVPPPELPPAVERPAPPPAAPPAPAPAPAAAPARPPVPKLIERFMRHEGHEELARPRAPQPVGARLPGAPAAAAATLAPAEAIDMPTVMAELRTLREEARDLLDRMIRLEDRLRGH